MPFALALRARGVSRRRRRSDGDAGGGGKAMFVELGSGASSSWDVKLETGAGVVLRAVCGADSGGGTDPRSGAAHLAVRRAGGHA